jgi:hypothetical protein
MSKFVSLNILASMVLGRSKKTAGRETPGAPPVAEQRGGGEPSAGTREEPPSSSRMRVNRVRVEG